LPRAPASLTAAGLRFAFWRREHAPQAIAPASSCDHKRLAAPDDGARRIEARGDVV
jgi:hypothetical protein